MGIWSHGRGAWVSDGLTVSAVGVETPGRNEGPDGREADRCGIVESARRKPAASSSPEGLNPSTASRTARRARRSSDNGSRAVRHDVWQDSTTGEYDGCSCPHCGAVFPTAWRSNHPPAALRPSKTTTQLEHDDCGGSFAPNSRPENSSCDNRRAVHHAYRRDAPHRGCG